MEISQIDGPLETPPLLRLWFLLTFTLNCIAFFTGFGPPEWRWFASVAYFKDKLYYIGGEYPETYNRTNRVDVRRSNKSP